MDPILKLLIKVDPVLIAPYRWFDDPMIGWWVGTSILTLWATFLGELTLAVAYRVNRAYMAKKSREALYYQEQSLRARQAGDEKAYKGINKLANEAFGQSFFSSIAMGMGSLWPAFLAAAWLNERFREVRFVLPSWAGDLELSFLGPFILLYIAARVTFVKLRPHIPFLNQASREVRRRPL